jgi:FAD/FMN-containing dehydrogenase
MTNNTLKDKLVKLLGEAYVLHDTESCVLYAQDVYTKDKPSLLVIQPTSSQLVAQAVNLITDAGLAVIPRGGGMSYTKGFVPAENNSIIVDTSLLNQIFEVNEEDMYVRVGSGCTWKQLHDKLKNTGLRTPFWGTLSGSRATVGGGLSQNGIFWGSGQHGFAVDSVISLEVVLATGKILNTGSGALVNGTPFMRHYGPDLTGLFCADNAALGIKTSVTLRLVHQSKVTDGISFCFDSFAQQSAVMSEVSRRGLVTETCGFDPFLQAQRLKRESLASDVKSLVGVMKAAGGLGKAIKQGAKVALAGRNFVEADSWSVHFFVEDRTDSAVKERIDEIREIAQQYQCVEIENTIPKVLRANPFGPVNNMIGPNGERWAPVHTLVPHSKAELAYQTSSEIFAKHQTAIDTFNIGIGYLLATVSTNVFVLEPVFFWPDELNELHHHAIEPQHLKRMTPFKASPEARSAVQAIREDLIHAYKDLGGVHMQIGKTYLFEQGVNTSNFTLLKSIKALVDPKNRMNPTVLGL